MLRYVVTAVRLNGNGSQDSFMLGRVDTNTNDWVAQPAPVPVITVVDHLMHGSPITLLFPTEDGLTPGPFLEVFVLPNAIENVRAVAAPVGQMVNDLPHF